MSETILRLPEVRSRTGLSRSTIYLKINNDPGFPKPVSLGQRAIGFISSEVDGWIEARIAESRQRAAS